LEKNIISFAMRRHLPGPGRAGLDTPLLPAPAGLSQATAPTGAWLKRPSRRCSLRARAATALLVLLAASLPCHH